jgi:hypothetical protein
MTKTVNIPLTELREIYQGLEALVFAVPSDCIALASWKEQLELRLSAARALGSLKAYTIDLTPEPTMHDEYEYALDHYGLDNWQAEWGDGDIERDIVVKYDETHRGFDYVVLMDGEDITAMLNADNRKAFEGLMEKERAQRRAIREDYAYD